ncbi:SDR family NAD(P)-dependent oxidoreductase [Aromatoleum toluclasticum]|uniref:SDR family NAD(P)-dependent oxidoreductase n=1 Tax=Aromatoleum toluclasticum TaxID=92003 RepID=UPI00036154AA|nr:SDR family oxidoreductase [Aromatoleum toluclasticum]
MEKVLEKRVALVTGAASGIGQAIAHAYIEAGAEVLAVDRSAFSAEDARRPGLVTMQADLTAPGAVEQIVKTAAERWGRLDVLVNNAGVAPYALLEETSDELWDQTVLINLTLVFRLCRGALPLLKSSKSGRIINIGSVMSSFGSAGLSAYATTKHGVAGLTKCLASELGLYGITANLIQPGAVVTGITRDAFAQDDAFRTFWEGKAALGRLGQPDDIAPVAVFLASDGAGFVSGQGFIVDGGAVQKP